jgi:hypothetical protein
MKNNNQNMFQQKLNRTGGVMDRVVVLGAVDGTFNPEQYFSYIMTKVF